MNAFSPVWHPFTQHALEPPFKRIARTEGAYLIDEDGRRIFDAIASWWVITHGHRHPAIMQAIQQACENYDQIIFAEYSHAEAELLGRELCQFAPPGLEYVFFSDSGSTSVEVALKMALGYFHNLGSARSRIVVLEHAYHGDTIGTMSVGARGVFNAAYTRLLFEVETIPFPEPGREQDCLDALAAICVRGDVAALLIEPLLLGAGGMKIYPAWVLAEFRRMTAQHDVWLIADEVMTGWGRTGTRFACEQAGIAPDILCTSKGLTGGSLPLAATLCRPEIYQAHLSQDRSKTFFHSSSYTANAIACAAARANLAVWRAEPVAERIHALTALQAARLVRFKDDPRFRQVRQLGTLAALDLNCGSNGYLASVAPALRAFFRERDLLLRPLGNVIYLLPPYCSTAAELDRAYAAIDEAAGWLGRAVG